MEIAIILSAFIQVVVLIIFIQLTVDVTNIRKILGSRDPYTWLNRYKKNIALDRKEEAFTSLQEFIWYQCNGKFTGKVYENLKSKYETKFEALGKKFPDEIKS
jgi:methionine salvage enolase-phosphatase E1